MNIILFSDSLQDEHILDLSKRIPDRNGLLEFGIKVLSFPKYTINQALRDYQNSIQAASHELLSEWLDRHSSRQEAYMSLLEGLKRAQMEQLAAELQSLVKGVSPEPYHVTLPVSQNYEESEFI